MSDAHRNDPKGAVVFVDLGRWESFHQVAALVREAGCHCIRVTSEPSPVKRALSRLVFDEVVHCPIPEIAEWLANQAVAVFSDVLMTDEAVAALAAGTDPLSAPSGPSAPSIDALLLGRDKLRQADLFAHHGIAQPDYLPAADTEPDQAIATLGLPLVVKQAVGYGGYGVRVAENRAQVVAAVADLARAGPTNPIFFQRHLDGAEFNYGCTALGGMPLQEATYVQTSVVSRRFGQATASELVSDPELVALGRAVVEVLGVSGFLNLGTIRDAGGRHQVIDVNPRPWGGFASLSDVGIDLGPSYLHAIGVEARVPDAAPARPGRSFHSFPNWEQRQLVDDGVTRHNLAAYLQAAGRYRRSISTRYWLETMAFTTLHVARRRPAVALSNRRHRRLLRAT